MMIYSYDSLVRVWPVLFLTVLVVIIFYYMTREDKETYYSPRAMDQYLNKIKELIWREAEKRLHALRNQDHAKILKTKNEVKKHKQAYVYSRDFLLSDLAKNMGFYGRVPDYVQVYCESRNINKEPDKSVMQKMYKEILADETVRIYYVYYDLDSHSYKWLDIVEAASKSNVPMSTSARNVVETANMLNMHFEMGEKARIDWHKLDKYDYLGYVINENDETIKLLMHKGDGLSSGEPVKAQLYKHSADSQLVVNSSDLLSFSELFDLALDKCTKLRMNELARIKAFNKKQDLKKTEKPKEKSDKVIDLKEKEKDEH